MKEYREIQEQVASLEADAVKFFEKGNHAAGVRYRKGLMALKNMAHAARKTAVPTT